MLSKNLKETKAYAAEMARKFLSDSSDRRGALIFTLKGELGSGKTSFAQGLAKALGVKGLVPSPTFLIFRKYPLKHKKFTYLYHVDLYRIKEEKEVTSLGFQEILLDPKNIVLIEWPGRAKNVLPGDVISLSFQHGENENERIIEVEN